MKVIIVLKVASVSRSNHQTLLPARAIVTAMVPSTEPVAILEQVSVTNVILETLAVQGILVQTDCVVSTTPALLVK